MAMTALGKRLTNLEAIRTVAPVRLTPEEIKAAARAYEASLAAEPPPDSRAVAYWERASLQRLADDYQAMLKGALAPWETNEPGVRP